MDKTIKSALADVRVSAQELHTAIGNAAARRGETMKDDLHAAGLRARSVADAIGNALDGQNDAARKHLKLAMASLDAFQRHAEAALKETAEALHTAVGQARQEARACADEVGAAAAQMRAGKAPPARA